MKYGRCRKYNYFVKYFVNLDGTDFPKYKGYYCKSYFKTEDSLVDALNECRSNINCSMVSSSNCANVTSHYHLCDQTTELKPDLEACYHWKKGNFAESENCILAWN